MEKCTFCGFDPEAAPAVSLETIRHKGCSMTKDNNHNFALFIKLYYLLLFLIYRELYLEGNSLTELPPATFTSLSNLLVLNMSRYVYLFIYLFT